MRILERSSVLLRTGIILWALSSSGCVTVTSPEVTTRSGLPVEMQVVLIAGRDGGPVSGGGPAVFILRLRNTKSHALKVPLWCMSGKGAPSSSTPTYVLPEWAWYEGFEAARARVTFFRSNHEIALVREVQLFYPDIEVPVEADAFFGLCVEIPRERETFMVSVTLDNENVKRAMMSNNSSRFWTYSFGIAESKAVTMEIP